VGSQNFHLRMHNCERELLVRQLMKVSRVHEGSQEQSERMPSVQPLDFRWQEIEDREIKGFCAGGSTLWTATTNRLILAKTPVSRFGPSL
jgi:hypothetical protein